MKKVVNLNLFKLMWHMSITAHVSILHRVSGVLLFLALPFILYLLHLSLINPDFYGVSYSFLHLPLMKIVGLVLIWAIIHHLCAGIRFLFLDKHIAGDRITAQRTAKIVMLVSVCLTIILGWMVLC